MKSQHKQLAMELKDHQSPAEIPSWEKYESQYPEVLTKELLYDLITKRLGCSRSTAFRRYRQYFPIYSYSVDIDRNCHSQMGITFKEANRIIDRIVTSATIIEHPRVDL